MDLFLTKAERRVLDAIVETGRQRSVPDLLNISMHTVTSHVANMKAKNDMTLYQILYYYK